MVVKIDQPRFTKALLYKCSDKNHINKIGGRRGKKGFGFLDMRLVAVFFINWIFG